MPLVLVSATLFWDKSQVPRISGGFNTGVIIKTYIGPVWTTNFFSLFATTAGNSSLS
jgi:hypothetical protein